MPNVNVDEFIKKEGKLLRRKVAEKTENFLNNIINLSGTIVYSLVMGGEKDTIYAIKFPEKILSDVSSIFMDFILDTPFQVDVLLLNKENSFPEPSFIKLIKIIQAWLFKIYLDNDRMEDARRRIKEWE